MTRRVLITGASRGIGRAIAVDMARHEFSVVVNYHQRRSAAEDTLAEIESSGGKGGLLPFDVSDRDASKKALGEDIAANGSYYGVVCNAGVHEDAPFPSVASHLCSTRHPTDKPCGPLRRFDRLRA